MAQTTTGRTGCDVVIWVDNESNTLTNISGSTNSVSLSLTNNVSGGTYTFGSQWPTRFACGKDATISASIIFTTAADEAFDTLLTWYHDPSTASARSLRIQAPDGSSGSEQWDMEVYLAELSWDMTAGDAEPMMVSVTFTPTNEVVHNNIGS